jgi:predicted AlkP superfamily phosphohydrolase/phosphomutase
MSKSILLIGIDGAPWKLLRPWMEKGHLKTINKLSKEGVTGDARSIMPLESGSAWVTLSTGKNPGKHGIYDFLTDSGKLINSNLVKSKRIWNILSDAGKKCSIVNIPVTYPLENINGYMVSDFLTPPDVKEYASPKELMTILNKYGYKIDIKHEKYAFILDTSKFSEKRYEYLDELYDIMEKRFLVLKEIMDKEWDLFMINFKECDALLHYFWDKEDVLLKFFNKLDDYLSELINLYMSKNNDTYILIVSDHGFDAAPIKAFNIGAWLRQKGIIKDNRTIFQNAVTLAYKIIKKVPLSKIIFKSNKAQEVRESFQRNLTSSSKIFFRQFGLHIDAEKYSHEEYENLRAKLMDELKDVEYFGEKIFQLIGKRENFYSGPYANLAPDVIALPHPKYDIIFDIQSNQIFSDIHIPIPGKHIASPYGMFLIHGNSVNKDHKIELSLMDIAPTILHILDIPIPDDTDGKILKEAFNQDSEIYIKEVKFNEPNGNFSEEEKIKNIIRQIKF